MAAVVRKPAALRQGGRIAVVMPSGPVLRENLAAGMAALERHGFEVVPPPEREPHRLFSAGDAERLADLRAAFADPSNDVVWCARGGWGAQRLLPGLDSAWLRERGRLCVGFSDATALLSHLVEHAGVAALHGPMVAHDVAREDASGRLAEMLALLQGKAEWSVPVPETLIPGEVRAPVRGGCLTVLAALAGTPWQPSFRDAIAFFEDVAERPQRRIDRMLTQLLQAGAFAGVRGFVFGTMLDCGPSEELRETILGGIGELGVPVGFGAPVGHGPINLPVPLGLPAQLVLPSKGGGTLGGNEPMVRL